jgi:hypothetical protein
VCSLHATEAFTGEFAKKLTILRSAKREAGADGGDSNPRFYHAPLNRQIYL